MPVTDSLVSLPERYRVTRRIASGGMATVYAAEDTLLGRLVAVKVLAPALAAEADGRERFQREARAAARVSDHPNVVTIYDIGEHEDKAFIVMEYLPAGTVAERLRGDEPIPHPLALRWLEEAASALDHAHSEGIVHRDVKPANLLLDANGRLAVADFGIARMATDTGMTMTGQVLGTAAYLSPEQAMGQPATAASDRYALAVLAFELLTGRRPFQAEHVAAQARAHVETPPPRASEIAPTLPAGVDRALWRGLEKDPRDRWTSAGAMVAALEDALGERAEPITAPTAPAAMPATQVIAPVAPRRRRPQAAAAAPVPRGARSRRALWLALALVALLVGAAIAGAGGGSGGTPARHTTSTPAHRAKPRPKARRKPAAAAPATTAPAAPAGASKSALQQRGHALIQAGQPAAAIPVLQQAVRDCPVATTDPCAYALYDLGHALRLAGRPADAIPVLEARLQNPFARDVVLAELALARQQAGQGTTAPSPGPGHGHGRAKGRKG